MEYGTGAIFGCPAHDQRDLEFARKYRLPVIPVVLPPGEDPATFTIGDTAYVDDGMLINSAFLDGLLGRGRKAGRRRAARKARAWRTDDGLPAARLGGFAPALLGLPDPGDPLQRMRDRPGAREGSARRHCRRTSASRFRAIRSITIRPGNTSIARAAADPRDARPIRWTRSSIHLGISCASARRAPRSRSSATRSITGCRSINTSAASSTRFSTCSTRGSSPAP